MSKSNISLIFDSKNWFMESNKSNLSSGHWPNVGEELKFRSFERPWSRSMNDKWVRRQKNICWGCFFKWGQPATSNTHSTIQLICLQQNLIFSMLQKWQQHPTQIFSVHTKLSHESSSHCHSWKWKFSGKLKIISRNSSPFPKYLLSRACAVHEWFSAQ